MKKILILGGARSGKSRYALELAHKLGDAVLFVATATASDEEMIERISKHKKQRPAVWRTLEVTSNIGNQIEHNIGNSRIVIIDCITLFIGNMFTSQPDPENPDVALLEKQVEREIHSLINTMNKIEATFIIVSNEVGLGLVPPNLMGRSYRDILGKANQILAQESDDIYFMVSGIPMVVKTPKSEE